MSRAVDRKGFATRTRFDVNAEQFGPELSDREVEIELTIRPLIDERHKLESARYEVGLEDQVGRCFKKTVQSFVANRESFLRPWNAPPVTAVRFVRIDRIVQREGGGKRLAVVGFEAEATGVFRLPDEEEFGPLSGYENWTEITPTEYAAAFANAVEALTLP